MRETSARRGRVALLLLAGFAFAGVSAAQKAHPPEITAEQIVAQNVAARGGLEAWRKVATMVWTGRLESAGSTPPVAPFVLEMKRPDKSRFEVTVRSEKSIRAFNGQEGWKLEPLRNGKAKIVPYSAEEVRFAKDAPGMDGPLIDHQAKGIAIALDGSEEIEGRRAWRLVVRLPSGTTRHVWIDEKTHLEVKSDRETSAYGRRGMVFLFYRGYRPFEGLQIPTLIETTSPEGRTANRMVIERVFVNKSLPDGTFGTPGAAATRE